MPDRPARSTPHPPVAIQQSRELSRTGSRNGRHRTGGALAVLLAIVAGGLLAPDALAASVTVRIADRLEPAIIRVAPGTTVTWRNVDDERHRMRSQGGPAPFDTGNLEPGERSSVTFRTPGTYPYLDERDDDDPAYHGTIVVTEGGAGGTGGAAGSGSGGAAGGGAAGGSAAPRTATVTMAGRTFSPAALTVAAGTTITFRNDDDREHTASERAGAFDTGVLDSGGVGSATLTAPGTYRYLCQIHPEMTGTITVTGTAPATPRPTPAPVTPSATAPGNAGGPGDARTVVAVTLVDFAFSPAEARVPVGGVLEVRNDGAAIHTLTAADGSLDSGFLDPGATYRTTFADPGSFAFVCRLHPDMALTVRVAGSATGGTTDGVSAGSAGGSPASPSPAAVGAVGDGPPPVATPAANQTVAEPAAAEPAAAATAPPGTGRALLVVVLVVVAVGAFARVLSRTARGAPGSRTTS